MIAWPPWSTATEPRPGRHVLIASGGGHLSELIRWSAQIGTDPDSLWVTFDSPQSRTLLQDCRVLHAPYVAPRDARGTAAAFRLIMKSIDWRREDFAAAITTGSALGVAGLAAARLHRVPAFYFESAARSAGPSLSGRLASLDPWIQTHCQNEAWAGRRWHYRGTLFDAFEAVPTGRSGHPSLFVTVGTIRPYRFDALVDAVLATGLADDRTVWQLGCGADRADLPGRVVAELDAGEFDRCIAAADVVITHAGVGTVLHLLESGVFPVVVPRRAARREHVDDHQGDLADTLRSRGVAEVREAGELTAGHLIAAAARAVRRSV